MKIQLLDNGKHLEFAPLTLLKPLAKLFVGAMTIEKRWNRFFPEAEFSYDTEDYLQKKYPFSKSAELNIAANILPNEDLAAAVFALENAQLFQGENWIATHGTGKDVVKYAGEEVIILEKRWDLYRYNEAIIRNDYHILTEGRKSGKLSSSVTVIGDKKQIFIEEGVKLEAATLNTTDGPIYLAKDAEVMEGSMIRGPFVLGEHATIKMGSKIYGGTSIGEHCKIGGEVSNSLFQGYSNKGHDGFVGNALIGEWCNIGADSNTSNLKNNYGKIRTYNYAIGKEEQTDLQFMGLTMGDHSKCGINTMFNTATVVGVSSNVFGAEFPAKFIPSFAWGGSSFVAFEFDKAVEASNNMMGRRGLSLSSEDLALLRHIYDKK